MWLSIHPHCVLLMHIQINWSFLANHNALHLLNANVVFLTNTNALHRGLDKLKANKNITIVILYVRFGGM